MANTAAAQKVEGKTRQGRTNCGGMTPLRKTWKEWQTKGEQQEKIELVGYCWQKT